MIYPILVVVSFVARCDTSVTVYTGLCLTGGTVLLNYFFGGDIFLYDVPHNF